MTDRQVSDAEILDFVRRTIARLIADHKDLDFETVLNSLAADTVLVGEDGAAAESIALDSLDTLDLISAIEKQYGTPLPDDIGIESVRTINDIVVLTAQTLAKQPALH